MDDAGASTENGAGDAAGDGDAEFRYVAAGCSGSGRGEMGMRKNGEDGEEEGKSSVFEVHFEPGWWDVEGFPYVLS